MALSNNIWRLSQSQQQNFPPQILAIRLQAGLSRITNAWETRRQQGRMPKCCELFSDRELWDIGLGQAIFRASSMGPYRWD